jgi:hypothetical protein
MRSFLVIASLFILFEVTYDVRSYFMCPSENRPQTEKQSAGNSSNTCSVADIVSAGPAAWISATTGAYIFERRDTINAASTLAIALFTGLLFFVSYSQVRLAREEFTASHRAKIQILAVEPIWQEGSDLIGAFITYVNTGESVANIAEIATKIFQAKSLRPGAILDKRKVVNTTLGVGEREVCGADSSILLREARAWLEPPVTAAVDRLHYETPDGTHYSADSIRVFCVGYIRYEDQPGRQRETGFCRWFDAGSQRWIRESNDEYEYDY